MSNVTYVDACLTGNALLDEIDDWVDEWHDDSAGSRSLDEFLGFTEEEGKLWAEKPSALRFIIAAHRSDVPVTELMVSRDEFALAARADDQEKASEVLAWLRTTGRI